MRTNLFAIQVLGLIAFIPAFVILEFDHKQLNVSEKKVSAKIAKAVTPNSSDTKNSVTVKGSFPHGIVFLCY